jgi:glycosyltransferase involved in cell wall biosynthesis
MLRWLERRTFATADLVFTTNESYRERASVRTRTPADEIVVVRSGPDPAQMLRGAAVPELRAGRTHLACYLGLMNPQDGVDVVLRAADHVVHGLGRDDVQFALLGDGDCGADLRRQARALGLDDHVTFTGMVGSNEIAHWLSTADIGLSPDSFTPFNDVSTMNKTLEYMAYELPVLAFRLTETVVSAGDAGEYVPTSGDPVRDATRFAEALVALLDDPDRRATMGRVGRERIEHGLGWPTSAAAYLSAYDRLTGRHLSLVTAA